MKNLGLIPLKNFGIVEEGRIYRCAQPLYSYEYKWLKEVLGIKTLINLRAEQKGQDYKFCAQYGIQYVGIPINDHKQPSMEDCDYFMDVLGGFYKPPFLIHCEHGRGRTSTFCVLARIQAGWDVNAAIREEEEKFHYSFQHQCQRDFLIKNYSNDTKRIKD